MKATEMYQVKILKYQIRQKILNFRRDVIINIILEININLHYTLSLKGTGYTIKMPTDKKKNKVEENEIFSTYNQL